MAHARFPEASGPPFPCPQPLSRDAERGHLKATSYFQKKINRCVGLVLFPGITCAIIALFWGQGRSSAPEEPSLWDINFTRALTVLIVGAVLILIGAVRVYRLAKAKSPHTKLLKAYGVPLDSSGTKKVCGSNTS